MRYTKMPDETGWYWLRTAGDLVFMSYVDAEAADGPKAALLDAGGPVELVDRPGVDPLAGAIWHGPLDCPFGDFASGHTQFSEEEHQSAEGRGRVLVSVTINRQHSGGPGAQETTTLVCDQVTAKRVARAMGDVIREVG